MIPKTLGKLGLKTAYGYIEKDPEHNLPKLMEWVDRLAGDGPNSFLVQRDAFRTVINDPDNNMHQLLMNIFREVDNDVLKARRNAVEIQLQYPLGYPTGPYQRLQPSLHRVLGCRIR